MRLPLLGKELLEQAGRTRTWVQRTVFAVLVTFFFLYFFQDQVGGFVDRVPLEVIGQGTRLLDITFAFLIAATYLVMPALMAATIIEEEKRGSLELLVLSGLSARSVIFEKLASRILPVVGWLLTAMPLLAIAYSLGGIDTTRLLSAFLALFLASLQAGLISMICASKAHTVVGSFWLSFLWVVLCLLFIFPFIGLILGLGLAVMPGVVLAGLGYPESIGFVGGFRVVLPPVFYYFSDHEPIWYPFFLSGLAIALNLVLFQIAVVSLRRRVSRPMVQRPPSPMNATQEQWRYLKRKKGSWIAKYFPPLPDDDPVRWMERKRTFIRGRAALEGVFFLVGLPLMLIAFLTLVSSWQMSEIYAENPAYPVLIALCWAVIIPGMVLVVVNAATGGLAEGTRDVLLTTPLRGRDILRQTMQGQRVQQLFFSSPIVVLVLAEIFAEQMVLSKVVWYLIGSITTGAIYLTLISWASMTVGLVFRQRLRALLVGIIGMLAWSLLPLLFWTFALDLMGIKEGNYGWWSLPWLISPVTMVSYLEGPTAFADTFPVGPWIVLGLNSCFYGAIAYALRTWCLARADRLLGRE